MHKKRKREKNKLCIWLTTLIKLKIKLEPSERLIGNVKHFLLLEHLGKAEDIHTLGRVAKPKQPNYLTDKNWNTKNARMQSQ